jgi:hypothetical protein
VRTFGRVRSIASVAKKNTIACALTAAHRNSASRQRCSVSRKMIAATAVTPMITGVLPTVLKNPDTPLPALLRSPASSRLTLSSTVNGPRMV